VSLRSARIEPADAHRLLQMRSLLPSEIVRLPGHGECVANLPWKHDISRERASFEVVLRMYRHHVSPAMYTFCKLRLFHRAGGGGMDIRIDVERLRRALIDYFGTAMTAGAWPAIADVSEVEDASPIELIRIAEREGIDLREFAVERF